jgi:hypothetical protein
VTPSKRDPCQSAPMYVTRPCGQSGLSLDQGGCSDNAGEGVDLSNWKWLGRAGMAGKAGRAAGQQGSKSIDGAAVSSSSLQQVNCHVCDMSLFSCLQKGRVSIKTINCYQRFLGIEVRHSFPQARLYSQTNRHWAEQYLDSPMQATPPKSVRPR